ncbi:MAG: nucleotide exchange factor GrpE [Acidobacteria bacterium]|nr:nucleotide exchange factor GrpE [Acidobacteriota bacterium]
MSDGTGKPEKINLDEILGGMDDSQKPGSDDSSIEIIGDTSPGTPHASSHAVSARLQEALAEKDRVHDLYLRARADLENFKRRMERERDEDRARAGSAVLREIIPALDNLDRALAQPEEALGFREGVTLIRRQIGESLRKLGLEPIDALGEPFDPTYHDAVAAEPREGLAPNTVIEEIAKGYTYAGRVLRPALVKVVIPSPKPAGSETQASERPEQGGSDGPDHRD